MLATCRSTVPQRGQEYRGLDSTLFLYAHGFGRWLIPLPLAYLRWTMGGKDGGRHDDKFIWFLKYMQLVLVFLVALRALLVSLSLLVFIFSFYALL